MIPAHTQVHLQLFVIIIVQVATQHLVGVQASTVPPTSILLLVVGIAHQHNTCLVREAAARSSHGVAVFRTSCNVKIGHITSVHTLLDGEVQHRLLFAVLNARDTALVTLLVVVFHRLNDAHRNILQGGLNIAQHKFLTVHENFLHDLTVDGDIAVFVYIRSWQALDKFLDSRTFGCAESFGVVEQGVLLHHHLRYICRHHRLFQQTVVGCHTDITQVQILFTTQRHLTFNRLISNKRNPQSERTHRGHIHGEVTSLVGDGTSYKRAVCHSKQLHRHVLHRFFRIDICQITINCKSSCFLRKGSQCHHTKQHK